MNVYAITRFLHTLASRLSMTAAVASGNPKRIGGYFLRRWAYRLLGRLVR